VRGEVCLFLDVESVNQRWIARRESLLRDTIVLVSQLDRECTETLERFVDRLTLLDVSEKAKLIKSPVFQRSISNVNDVVLAAYDYPFSTSPFVIGTSQLRSSISGLVDVFAAEATLSTLPTVGWIRIVTDASLAQFRTGGEYGIELDNDIDTGMWESVALRALELIRLSDVNYELVRNFVGYIVPLKQREAIQNLSFSSRELPNVIFKNHEGSALLFGEALVHEADHQFFYALEEHHSFWVIEPRFQPAAYHSPWRDDSRPLDGILRGLSAFTRVVEYYSYLVAVSETQLAEKSGALLVQRVAQCEAAAATLLESDELSNVGREYVLELSSILRDADESISFRELYSKWREDAVMAIKAHREKWRRSRKIDPSEITRDHL
jgi:hypothetical protein